MKVSVIIPVKKRLEHLKRCLPLVVSQHDCDIEVIVVDYNCPEGSGQWVKDNFSNYPWVKVVKAPVKEDEWSLSAARNLGFTKAAGEILFFLDADALLTDPCFISKHLKMLVEGSFICGWGYGEATGCCMIYYSAFKKAGGYNELIQSWGAEDIKLYDHLEKVLCIERRNWMGGIVTIKHGDELRNEFHGGRNPLETNEENFRITEHKGVN